jgi:hypothetical protein
MSPSDDAERHQPKSERDRNRNRNGCGTTEKTGEATRAKSKEASILGWHRDESFSQTLQGFPLAAGPGGLDHPAAPCGWWPMGALKTVTDSAQVVNRQRDRRRIAVAARCSTRPGELYDPIPRT